MTTSFHWEGKFRSRKTGLTPATFNFNVGAIRESERSLCIGEGIDLDFSTLSLSLSLSLSLFELVFQNDSDQVENTSNDV